MSDYFGKHGFKTTALLDSVKDRAQLARGIDREVWAYDRGVWVKAEDIIPEIIHDLVEDRYRMVHANTVRELVLAVPPVILDDRGLSGYVNFRNGMFDLSTGELGRHRADYYSTTQIPHDYDPEAPIPERFIDFLTEVVPGKELLLLELLGYSMLDGNPFQKAGMLTGTGANGKSVFLHLVESVIGPEYRSSVTLAQFSSDRDRFATSDLMGKLVNIAGDISSAWIKDTSTFKQIVGSDRIRGEYKGRQAFQFEARALSLFSANEIPQSYDVGLGYLRRWVPIHFPNQFLGPAQDPDLPAKLAVEIPGIIPMAIDALRGMIERGGFSDHLYAEDLEVFKVEIDPFRAFFDESIEEGEGAKLGRGDLYQAYLNWIEAQGMSHPLTARAAYKRLRALWLEKHGTEIVEYQSKAGGRGFRGIALAGGRAPGTEPF